MPDPLDPLEKAQREIVRLRFDNATLRALQTKVLRRSGGYETFMEDYKELLSTDKFKYSPKLYLPSTIPNDPDHSEIACVAFSDLHLTEQVRPEDSNGINVYNSVIAANRMWYYAQKVKKIINMHQGMYNIEKIWMPILGDLISGSIHLDQIRTNELEDCPAVVLCGRLLYMFCQEIGTIGLPVEIDAVHGNHPRTTLKMPTKRQAMVNLDWQIYEYLKDRLEGNDQFSVKVCTAQIGCKMLYDWRYLYEHGIQVSNGGEEAFEDRLRAIFDDPTYRAATGTKGASFDHIVIGNMHKPKFLERTIVNGSLIGQNELGQSWRLKPIKPIQQMWGVSKNQVKTWQYSIDMSSIKSQKADNPFSDYTKGFIKQHGR